MLTVYQRKRHINKYCRCCAIIGVFRLTCSPEELVITFDWVGARDGKGKSHRTYLNWALKAELEFSRNKERHLNRGNVQVPIYKRKKGCDHIQRSTS